MVNNMKNIYKIADKVILINSIYNDVHNYCKDYQYDGKVDFTVTISPQDIEYEKEKSAREDKIENRPVRRYSEGYLEELAVYRKIAEKMIEYNTILFHGSVVSVKDEAYLFTAKSGTGKSTHTRLWRQLFGDKAVMVNDDKPLIRIENGEAFVFGTPYNGKHRLGNNLCVKLKSIAVLERSENNSVSPLSKEEAFPMLLQQCFRSSDTQKVIRTLQLLNQLSETVKLYKLKCNMDIEAAETAYNYMK